MSPFIQYCCLAGACLVGSVAGAQNGQLDALDDPFLRPVQQARSAPAEADALEGLELTGILTLGGRTRVCLADARSSRTRWLSVGDADGGLVAVEFDAQRTAVRIESGGASRWVALRRATVVSMALPRMEHGAIDWAHMRMTDKQKAREAEAMVTDILEVAQLGRAGKLGATR